jgi:predicted TIM-barrel fold metal-dependent hydrolase
MHILDSRYPLWAGAVLDPPDASVEDYAKVHERIGIARCVVAAPSIYGADNSCTRDAIASLGIPAKGTAVLTKDTTLAQIAELDRVGFVAARFNCIQGGPWKLEDIAPIAHRIAEFGWHVQVYASPRLIVAMTQILASLPVPLLVEHAGHIREPDGEDAEAFALVMKLVDGGKTWVKLSSPYLEPDARGERQDRFANTVSAFAGAIPERLVWGSDWPHATEPDAIDTFELFSQFCAFVGNEATLDRILVENPKQLYRFGAQAPIA